MYREALGPHLFAETAEIGNRVNARLVPLLPLQTAHLRNQHLCSAHLHAVDNVRDFHQALAIFSISGV
jgi:hypothetical protein